MLELIESISAFMYSVRSCNPCSYPGRLGFFILRLCGSDVSIASPVSIAVSGSVLDTSVRLSKLSQKVQAIMREKLIDEDRGMVHELMDLYGEKIMQYKEIAPHAETLKKLQDGEIRKGRKRTRHVSEVRVLNT